MCNDNDTLVKKLQLREDMVYLAIKRKSSELAKRILQIHPQLSSKALYLAAKNEDITCLTKERGEFSGATTISALACVTPLDWKTELCLISTEPNLEQRSLLTAAFKERNQNLIESIVYAISICQPNDILNPFFNDLFDPEVTYRTFDLARNTNQHQVANELLQNNQSRLLIGAIRFKDNALIARLQNEFKVDLTQGLDYAIQQKYYLEAQELIHLGANELPALLKAATSNVSQFLEMLHHFSNPSEKLELVIQELRKSEDIEAIRLNMGNLLVHAFLDESKNQQLIKRLLQNGAEPDMALLALYLSGEGNINKTEVSNRLFKVGADKNNVLKYLITQKLWELIETFQNDQDIKLEITNKEISTLLVDELYKALIRQSQADDDDVNEEVEALIRLGANLNKTLDKCLMEGTLSLVKGLIERGAHPTHLDMSETKNFKEAKRNIFILSNMKINTTFDSQIQLLSVGIDFHDIAYKVIAECLADKQWEILNNIINSGYNIDYHLLDPKLRLNYNQAIKDAVQAGQIKIANHLLTNVGYPIVTDSSNLDQILNAPPNAQSSQDEAIRVCYYNQLVESNKLTLLNALKKAGNENSQEGSTTTKAKETYEQSVIKYFKEDFDRYGKNDQERLHAIEKEIRKMILERLQHGDDKLIKDYIIAHKEQLLAQDKAILAEFRTLLHDNLDINQVAWRAYDPFAPISGWPNLLTAPPSLELGDERVFTTAASSNERLTRASASEHARRMSAYYYLVAKDAYDGSLDDSGNRNKKPASKSQLEERETGYVTQLASIRRAHNEDIGDIHGTDNPSCYPGVFSRLGIAGMTHPLASIMYQSPAKQMIRDKMSGIVQEAYRETIVEPDAKTLKMSAEEIKNLCMALCSPSGTNAYRILVGSEETVPLHQYNLRSAFVAQLPSLDVIQQDIETRLGKTLEPDDVEYLTALFVDIGGVHVSSALAALCDRYTNPKTQKALESTISNFSNPYNVISFEKALAQAKIRDKTKTLSESELKSKAEKTHRMSVQNHELFELIYPILSNVSAWKGAPEDVRVEHAGKCAIKLIDGLTDLKDRSALEDLFKLTLKNAFFLSTYENLSGAAISGALINKIASTLMPKAAVLSSVSVETPSSPVILSHDPRKFLFQGISFTPEKSVLAQKNQLSTINAIIQKENKKLGTKGTLLPEFQSYEEMKRFFEALNTKTIKLKK